MPLGMEVGLGPGDIVLDRTQLLPSPQKRGAQPPIFGPCLLWPNGCMYQDTTWCGGRPQPGRHCVRWGPSSPTPKGAHPLMFGPCLLWPNGWMDQDLMHLVRRQASAQVALCYMGNQLRQRKGHSSPPPVFGPCLLWLRSLISATAFQSLRGRPTSEALKWTSPTKKTYMHLLCQV